MYRQCDMQNEASVIRAWISEKNAVEGTRVQVHGSAYEITRTHGYCLDNLGVIELPDRFRR